MAYECLIRFVHGPFNVFATFTLEKKKSTVEYRGSTVGILWQGRCSMSIVFVERHIVNDIFNY